MPWLGVACVGSVVAFPGVGVPVVASGSELAGYRPVPVRRSGGNNPYQPVDPVERQGIGYRDPTGDEASAAADRCASW